MDNIISFTDKAAKNKKLAFPKWPEANHIPKSEPYPINANKDNKDNKEAKAKEFNPYNYSCQTGHLIWKGFITPPAYVICIEDDQGPDNDPIGPSTPSPKRSYRPQSPQPLNAA